MEELDNANDEEALLQWSVITNPILDLGLQIGKGRKYQGQTGMITKIVSKINMMGCKILFASNENMKINLM